MMITPAPPLRPATCLLLVAALPALTGCAAPARPVSPTAVPAPVHSGAAISAFGDGDLYILYDRDSTGLPVALRQVTTDPGLALEPFLTDASAARSLDCLRLRPPPAGDVSAPLVSLCHAALWRSRAQTGTSPLATSDGAAPLTRLTDSTLLQIRQAVSGLGTLTGPATPPAAEPTGAAESPEPPLVQAARRVLPLLEIAYSKDKTDALSGRPDAVTAFLQTYPTAPAPDRQAVTGAALHHTITRLSPRPDAPVGELRRVLRVLPLTPDQKTQGLEALRRLNSLDGWLSALRLGGTATDLRQARALAAATPGKQDDRLVEESTALDRALQSPEGVAALFSLSAPGTWETRPGPPDRLRQQTTVLSAPVTLAARPAASLRAGVYDITVRVSATSHRTYSRLTAAGESVQATAHSRTETDVVFTLSPPSYQQTLTVTLPEIPAPGTPAENRPPEISLTVLSADLRP